MSNDKELCEDFIIKVSRAQDLLKELTKYMHDDVEYFYYYHRLEIKQKDINSVDQVCKDLEQICKFLELEI